MTFLYQSFAAFALFALIAGTAAWFEGDKKNRDRWYAASACCVVWSVACWAIVELSK